jgi:hypothetical protein
MLPPKLTKANNIVINRNKIEYMKKLLILFTLAVVISTVAYSQVSFGIKAGVNFQNLNGKDADDDKLENKLIPGFHAGFDVAIPIAQDFYVQPGLLFSTKGAKSEGTLLGDVKTTLGYIELPLHLLYKPQLGTGKLILGFGPYLAYGITGKIKRETGSDIDIKFKSDLTTQDLIERAAAQTDFLKGFDAGADIFFGYEFAFKVSVVVNAQLGLLNLEPDYEGNDNDERITKNTGFSVSLGYSF